jgi:hypothetical protein
VVFCSAPDEFLVEVRDNDITEEFLTVVAWWYRYRRLNCHSTVTPVLWLHFVQRSRIQNLHINKQHFEQLINFSHKPKLQGRHGRHGSIKIIKPLRCSDFHQGTAWNVSDHHLDRTKDLLKMTQRHKCFANLIV